MLLTFSKPKFEKLIKDEIKIHTIREDKGNRWKVGTKIHFWLGNPRNIRAKVPPKSFGVGYVKEIKEIEFHWWKPEHPNLYTNPLDDLTNGRYCDVYIDGQVISIEQIHYLAISDGFNDRLDFFKFFNQDFKGKLIYWKDCTWL